MRMLVSRRVRQVLDYSPPSPSTPRADPRRRPAVRMSLRDLERDYEKSEDDIKALQSVGQIIGEVLKQLDEERCTSSLPLPSRLSSTLTD